MDSLNIQIVWICNDQFFQILKLRELDLVIFSVVPDVNWIQWFDLELLLKMRILLLDLIFDFIGSQVMILVTLDELFEQSMHFLS